MDVVHISMTETIVVMRFIITSQKDYVHVQPASLNQCAIRIATHFQNGQILRSFIRHYKNLYILIKL